MNEEFVRISRRCDDLEAQVRRLEELVARGFGHMAESKDSTARVASAQVTQTVKSWNRERRKPKETSG